MPSYLLVVNPKSGRGTGLARAEVLRSALSRDGDIEVLQTERRGHASEAVAEHAQRFDRVVAIGGDGTLNEVLAGLVRVAAPADHIPALGFLASGTANAATRAFGLSAKPESTARRLLSADARPVDVGIASYDGVERPFLLWCGAGYDAIVIDALNRERTDQMGISGLARGFPGVLRAIRRYAAPEITIRSAEGDPKSAGSVVLTNVAHMAFGTTTTRAADPFDGRMDVLTVPRRGTLGVAGLWLRMLLSSLEHAPGVERTSVTRVRLEADGYVPFQLDGEPVGSLPVEVRVVPRAVRFLLT